MGRARAGTMDRLHAAATLHALAPSTTGRSSGPVARVRRGLAVEAHGIRQPDSIQSAALLGGPCSLTPRSRIVV